MDLTGNKLLGFERDSDLELDPGIIKYLHIYRLYTQYIAEGMRVNMGV